jgi:hypothetical protein
MAVQNKLCCAGRISHQKLQRIPGIELGIGRPLLLPSEEREVPRTISSPWIENRRLESDKEILSQGYEELLSLLGKALNETRHNVVSPRVGNCVGGVVS